MVEAGAVLLDDGRFAYSTGDSVASVCRLRVYEGETGMILLVSELADNPGGSITNTAGALAAALAEHYGPDIKRAVFIEHYDDASYHGLSCEPSFSQVSFTWVGDTAASPCWKSLSEAELANYGLPAALWSRS